MWQSLPPDVSHVRQMPDMSDMTEGILHHVRVHAQSSRGFSQTGAEQAQEGRTSRSLAASPRRKTVREGVLMFLAMLMISSEARHAERHILGGHARKVEGVERHLRRRLPDGLRRHRSDHLPRDTPLACRDTATRLAAQSLGRCGMASWSLEC